MLDIHISQCCKQIVQKTSLGSCREDNPIGVNKSIKCGKYELGYYYTTKLGGGVDKTIRVRNLKF